MIKAGVAVTLFSFRSAISHTSSAPRRLSWREGRRRPETPRPRLAQTRRGTGVARGYGIYIYKVVKTGAHTGICSKAMSIVDSFVNDVFERIATEASRLAHYNKKSTITSREVQTAVRLLLPGSLPSISRRGHQGRHQVHDFQVARRYQPNGSFSEPKQLHERCFAFLLLVSLFPLLFSTLGVIH